MPAPQFPLETRETIVVQASSLQINRLRHKKPSRSKRSGTEWFTIKR